MGAGFGFGFGLAVVLGVGAAVGSCAYYYPQYNVYAQRMAGQAEYQRAESNRRIRVEEARVSLEAADMTAQAEIKRAQGVAEANRIVADSLGGSEGYLRWRYIEMLESGSGGNQIIYIPTEAAMPILEAGKRRGAE